MSGHLELEWVKGWVVQQVSKNPSTTIGLAQRLSASCCPYHTSQANQFGNVEALPGTRPVLERALSDLVKSGEIELSASKGGGSWLWRIHS
jgi:hypothetical protein